MGKLVMVGLDGAPFELIRRWVEEGKLIHLGRIIEKGAFGPLLSTYLPETPIAWTTIVTGKNAGKHGVFDWGERIDGSYHIGVTTSASCKEPFLWDLVGREGKSVGIFNVPLTYPPKEVNGFLVSGFDTPNLKSCFTHPASLSKEILSVFQDYVLSVQETYTEGKEEAYVEGLMFSLEKKEETALYLMDRYPTDFSMFVFMELDHLHHKLWRLIENGSEKEKNLFQRMYQRMDETVGKILSRFDDDTTFMIISDHGAGPLRGVMFINKWLMDQGWLRLKKEPSLLFKSFLSRTDLVPKVYRLASRVRLGRLAKYLSPSLQHKLATSFMSFDDVDWGKTQAYAYGEYGQIFINLKGREPQGVVAPGEEYEQLLAKITEELLRLRHPQTGQPMIKEVCRKEVLYSGRMLEKAPDLTFAIDEFRYDSSVKFGLGMKEVFGPPEFEDSGTHRREGIWIVSGKGIRSGYRIEGADVLDIAPTILYLLGLPIPTDMDGKVLMDMFMEDWVQNHPAHYRQEGGKPEPSEPEKTVSTEEMEAVKNKLRALGYLD